MVARLARDRTDLLVYAILIFFAVLMLVPFAVAVFTSLKPKEELLFSGINLLPSNPRPYNYVEAMQAADWGRYFLNSTFVTVTCVVISLLFNSVAGFSFARLHFRGRDFLFFFMLIGIMIPPQAIIIPQFLMFRAVPLAGGNDIAGQGGIGWLNTYWALIMPWLAGSFGIFLCRQYYINFPTELDEAARLDGCGPLRLFLDIYLPLSGPVLAALAILKTVFMWNDFFYPLIMTTTDNMRTVQLGLQVFAGEYMTDWNLLMAAQVLVTLPLIVMFFFLQRYFVEGIVTTGLKG
ncbi:MAG: carbohydrate ABC transporter permease [Chloroflexi bacterium]|nr:carbohydrate ABC transporter permease [Chloroflexota bacterium]MCL5109028.1 carbohydrate ABC transporter permease [Chloroflexota bacterium]